MALRKNIDVDRARQLRDSGMGWEEIGRQMGTTHTTVRTRLDPDYAELRRQQIRETRTVNKHQVTVTRRVKPSDEMERFAAIPPDTRNITGRLCGDPLPGRSALDQRKPIEC